MKMNRFFVSDKLAGKGSIALANPSLTNQLKNVFRLGKGDQVTLFDNSGYDFLSSIEGYENDTVSFSIVKATENIVLPLRETYLFASVVKKDNFEWMVQKATELGVSHIIPIVSDRSEKKDLNMERLQKIIVEAAEQSGRGTLPILYEITDLKSALGNYGHVKSIAWHTQANKFVSPDMIDVIGAYIGPEGGWSSDELDLFNQHGVHIRSLGPQVLRAETAVVAVISRLVF